MFYENFQMFTNRFDAIFVWKMAPTRFQIDGGVGG